MKIITLISIILITALIGSAQTDAGKPVSDETIKLSAEAVRLFNDAKYEDAEAIAKKVISIRDEKLGKNHLSLAGSWRNLAYIELKLNKRKEAEDAFDRALEILENNEPLAKANEEMLAEMLETAAYFDVGDGTISKSESRLKRAIELREKINGKDAQETAGPLVTLGQIYNARGEYEKALPLLMRGLEIRSKDGRADNDTTVLRATAKCSATKLERKDEAEEIDRKYKSSAVDVGRVPASNTINGGVLNGKAFALPKPAYPREARDQRASGAVAVQVLIDETGKVIFACAVNGNKLLHSATEFSAYQAKFTPTTLSGKPVKVFGIITYNFVP